MGKIVHSEFIRLSGAAVCLRIVELCQKQRLPLGHATGVRVVVRETESFVVRSKKRIPAKSRKIPEMTVHFNRIAELLLSLLITS